MRALALLSVLSAWSFAQEVPKVVEASLFKNGLAVVTREVSIQGGKPVVISPVPTAGLGTFWITASPGVTITEATLTTLVRREERFAANFDELLAANLNQQVTLMLTSNADAPREVRGKLLSSEGQLALVETSSGLIASRKSDVVGLAVQGVPTTKVPREVTTRALQISSTGRAGRIRLIGLERGLTWVPSYAVDITDPKKLRLTARATLMNDLAVLDGTPLKLITGFPNLPFSNVLDPITSGATVAEFFNWMMRTGNLGDSAGFGGGGMMMQNAAPAAARRESFDGAFPVSNVNVSQEGDLFFYPIDRVTMKPGDRRYQVLFTLESEYQHLYTWDVNGGLILLNGHRQGGGADGVPQEVWHTLDFKNTQSFPLTTATATTFDNGQVIGQDMLNYSSAGADVNLKITRALEVAPEFAEEEISRQRGALELRNVGAFDLVTMKGTLEAVNRLKEPIQLRIRQQVPGEILTVQGSPKQVKVSAGLRDVNPRTALEWKVTIAPGERKSLEYTYKAYVRN